MSNENKKEYLTKYVKENQDRITLTIRKDEKARFDALITKLGISQVAYITMLVNNDATQRGEDPPFKNRTNVRLFNN